MHHESTLRRRPVCGRHVIWLSLWLAACGGGGGATSPAPDVPPPPGRPAAVLNGKVIDGYVRGASVWLDLNGNQQRDADEPSAVSKQGGDYALELSEAQRDCLPYTTLYVDVPVGAEDEEHGKVSEPYQLAIPPQLQPLAQGQVLHASPLTTVLWEELRNGLDKDPALNSCQALKQDSALRERLKTELDDTLKRLVNRHNLSPARIYADFVQTKDGAAHQLAVDIVRGLKAGFALRRQLLQQYPDASYLRAEVYRGRGDLPSDRLGVWYRSHSVKIGGLMRTERHRLADDLSTIVGTDYLRTVDSRPLGSTAAGAGTYTLMRVGYRSDASKPIFRCALYETVGTTPQNGLSYELTAYYARPRSQDSAAPCLSASSDEMDLVQGWDYYVREHQDKLDTITMFGIDRDGPGSAELQPWQRLGSQLDKLDLSWLAPKLSQAGYRFDETVTLPVSRWYKRSEDYRGLPVIMEKSSWMRWLRSRTQADGTRIEECSIDQGATWTAPC